MPNEPSGLAVGARLAPGQSVGPRQLSDADAWITGLRREQGPSRGQTDLVEVDTTPGGIAKYNPLALWPQVNHLTGGTRYAPHRHIGTLSGNGTGPSST